MQPFDGEYPSYALAAAMRGRGIVTSTSTEVLRMFSGVIAAGNDSTAELAKPEWKYLVRDI